jgi:hypothetical protein
MVYGLNCCSYIAVSIRENPSLQKTPLRIINNCAGDQCDTRCKNKCQASLREIRHRLLHVPNWISCQRNSGLLGQTNFCAHSKSRINSRSSGIKCALLDAGSRLRVMSGSCRRPSWHVQRTRLRRETTLKAAGLAVTSWDGLATAVRGGAGRHRLGHSEPTAPRQEGGGWGRDSEIDACGWRWVDLYLSLSLCLLSSKLATPTSGFSLELLISTLLASLQQASLLEISSISSRPCVAPLRPISNC